MSADKTNVTVATITVDPNVMGHFMCLIDGNKVGSSKHQDYFEFHYRRGDILKLIKHKIDQFAYVNADGSVNVHEAKEPLHFKESKVEVRRRMKERQERFANAVANQDMAAAAA